MISKDAAFDALVEACPSYFAATDLDEYVAAFEDADTPDLFVRTSALAHHLVDRLAAGDDSPVVAVGVVVDRLLEEGDEETIELIALGLLESLQNIVSHDDVSVEPAQLRDTLGTRAVRVWDEHDVLWQDAARWRHQGPRVDQADYETIRDPDLRRYFQAHKRLMGDGVLIGASDIVHYQTELADLSALHPARRGRFPWMALAVGLALAIALAIAVHR